jgi:hypothetical protein
MSCQPFDEAILVLDLTSSKLVCGGRASGVRCSCGRVLSDRDYGWRDGTMS